jgi:hypothetical protein
MTLLLTLRYTSISNLIIKVRNVEHLVKIFEECPPFAILDCANSETSNFSE